MKILNYICCIAIFLTIGCNEHNYTPAAGELNASASLPASFNFTKMGLKVITSTINKKLGTMATLYGNDPAKATEQASDGTYKPGAIFVLVTWQQQSDKRWIGGNIPGELLSIEVIKAPAIQPNSKATYSLFKGPALKLDKHIAGQNQRMAYITGLKSSIMF